MTSFNIGDAVEEDNEEDSSTWKNSSVEYSFHRIGSQEKVEIEADCRDSAWEKLQSRTENWIEYTLHEFGKQVEVSVDYEQRN